MFDAIIQDASTRYNVPPSWVRAFIKIESNFNPDAFNPADPSYGLMQILDATARAYGITNLETLFDPEINIDVGAHLLHDLIASYGLNFEKVASAYNSGSATAYLTNSQVAAYVERAKAALRNYAEVGIFSGLLVLIMVGYLLTRRGRI